jgi:hypothetical protein
LSPAYLPSRNTATASTSPRDAVTDTFKGDHPLSLFARFFLWTLFGARQPLRRPHQARAAHFPHRGSAQ